MMLRVLILFSLGLMCAANVSPPQVNVYTYKPVSKGESNVLLCHAREFSPPNIKLDLLQDGVEIPNTEQFDLSFDPNWKFKLTKYVKFTPRDGVVYTCRVVHNGVTKVVKLDS
ncbi:beta-2-microglobulin-like [Hypanus sabinus]|uniref:beta-2-microglobulin-like n=1 Tax=Hypanus sabinus TaxID=79690 RepID=UPI0028C37D7C|nr:beta-2-microglobulin-like [Hypanus sabinus]